MFTRDRALPIVAVDEPIYRRLPCFLIATVDKFAQLPRNENVGVLFGAGASERLGLIIQDELHLISGPLESMTGLYEACIDLLCSDGEVRPKVIGSTATIGRARKQVRALFDRDVLQLDLRVGKLISLRNPRHCSSTTWGQVNSGSGTIVRS